jgi:hypothetical protein
VKLRVPRRMIEERERRHDRVRDRPRRSDGRGSVTKWRSPDELLGQPHCRVTGRGGIGLLSDVSAGWWRASRSRSVAVVGSG